MADNKFTQDYSMVCRTCLQANVEMLHLSALITDNLQQKDCKISYMDCLRSCIQLQDIEEEMPSRICLACASALQVAYWFMKNASQAQELLKNKLREIRYRQQQRELELSEEEMKKPKRYRCKICNVKVETKRSLKEHIKLHLDIIVYNCQLCTFESHKRSYLAEHYNQDHGVEASNEQLKPKTKTFNSATIKSEDSMMGAIKNEHFQVLPDNNQQPQLTFMDSYKNQLMANAITSSYSEPLEEATYLATDNNQQNFNTISQFSSIEGDLTAVSNDLSIGNEFIVMADGTVEEVMGKGVVIEYINAGNDCSLTLENGNLVLDNMMQVQNIDNTNNTFETSQNDIIQMDVDDIIIEDPVNTPEETEDLPQIVNEDIQTPPATVTEPPKKIICKICTKDFATQEPLKKHMLTHNEIPHFFCDQCTFYTFFKIDLHQHYKSKHNLHPTNKQLQPKNKQKTLKQVYTCDLCLFEADYKLDLKRHYLSKHKIDTNESHFKAATVENISAGTATYKSQTKRTAAVVQTKNVRIKPIEQTTPDYPNGLNCRKCNEVFYWRNKLYEHYKLHNAEEAALKQEKQLIKVQNKLQSQKAKPLAIITQTQQQPPQQQQQQQYQNVISQPILEQTTTTYTNMDSLSLTLTSNTASLNTMAPLTPSSSSTYTLPSDAIPQIVETDQTIENILDFDFNGDALFEDFDDDVDVENDSDNNDHEFRNVSLTSDDDFEEMLQEQNNPHNADAPTESYCPHCQKNFLSQYQFENHMFVHRGLAPYRCEMCTNLYNTKRCLIRHYKAVHKKVPTREMIQAKGDKVFADTTPIQNLNIEESKSATLMCAKCPYESTVFADMQNHLNTSHSLNEESYILRKLPYECPRCIRSFATKTKLLRHLERNHSSTPINKNQIQFDTIKTTPNSLTSTSTATINNHINMMQQTDTSDPNASCGYYDIYNKSQQQQQQFTDPYTIYRRTRKELSIEDAVAPNVVMSNFQDNTDDHDSGNNTNTTTTTTETSVVHNETTSSTNNNNKSNPTSSTNKSNIASSSSSTSLKQDLEDDTKAEVKEEEDDDEEEDDECDTDIEEFQEEQALFTCKICHLTCYNLESFDQHGKNTECRQYNKSFPDDKFECEICHCFYKSMYLLKHHLKRHIGRKFRCLQCPKTFINRIELESHQHVHSGERPHKCELCPKSFRYIHHLKRHRDIVHFGKRHDCTEPNCNRKFTTLAQLKGHIWTHNGIVPYKCPFCDRLYKKRLLLRKHCQSLHKVNLSEEEMATIFRKSLGYTNPHDFTVAITNGKMLRRADLETMGASGVIKSSFK